MDYEVAFQDPDLLIVDKPQGLATAPGTDACLCDAVFRDHPEIARVNGFRPGEGGLLNRLDNGTGGLVLFARNDDAFEYYSGLMKAEQVVKRYLAAVEGAFGEAEGLLSFEIAHHPKNKAKMVAVAGKTRHRGRIHQAATRYAVVSRSGGFSIVSLAITRGVRHQIRVHLAHAGHPVAGDRLYGSRNQPPVPHHLLFAVGLEFIDRNGTRRTVSIYEKVLGEIKAAIGELSGERDEKR
jgi:23S rRNA pseudouridine1911/1915/1917 synthase